MTGEERLSKALFDEKYSEYDGLSVVAIREIPDDYQGEVMYQASNGKIILFEAGPCRTLSFIHCL